ncbi:hypothetical protein [Fictibacillus fluitans]|uniref:Uncharacterized protein n=1 Tax=Fictibacillus fluitans TaxID=3058422 RepID=A0ABT8HYI2_9BACL|nr:hypothetical protein [Fictibacillus sp. NE201]MDN4525836.1 hypothetical protein [Fictibacillus sp. NE201]
MTRVVTYEPNKPDSTDIADIIRDAAEYTNEDSYRTDLLSVNHINILLHVIELLQEEKQEQVQCADQRLRQWNQQWEKGDLRFVPEVLAMLNTMVENPSPLLEQVDDFAPQK